MRTTIDLPAELHDIARALAHDQRRSMNAVLVDLVRRGLEPPKADDSPLPMRNGFPQMRFSRTITTEDVRRAQDDEL